MVRSLGSSVASVCCFILFQLPFLCSFQSCACFLCQFSFSVLPFLLLVPLLWCCILVGFSLYFLSICCPFCDYMYHSSVLLAIILLACISFFFLIVSSIGIVPVSARRMFVGVCWGRWRMVLRALLSIVSSCSVSFFVGSLHLSHMWWLVWWLPPLVAIQLPVLFHGILCFLFRPLSLGLQLVSFLLAFLFGLPNFLCCLSYFLGICKLGPPPVLPHLGWFVFLVLFLFLLLYIWVLRILCGFLAGSMVGCV